MLCFILAHSLTISVLHIFAQRLGFRVFPDFRLSIYSLVPELHSRMCCSLTGRLCSSNPPEAGVIRRPAVVSEIAVCLLPEFYCRSRWHRTLRRTCCGAGGAVHVVHGRVMRSGLVGERQWMVIKFREPYGREKKHKKSDTAVTINKSLDG